MGTRRYQPVWERLHDLALRGMNVGTGAFLSRSGELGVLDLIAGRVRADVRMVIFDVGANTGNYAAEVAARLGNRIRLHCFEPSPTAYARLAERLGGRDGISLHDFGLGDCEEIVPLYADTEGSELASTYPRRLEHLGVVMTAREEARLRTLDRFCEEERIAHIGLLKLDVEGNELRVLQGGRHMIESGSIDHIQFEFGGTNIDSRTYLKDYFDLLGSRYEIYRILVDGLAPIPVYREGYEIFETTNYLAIARSL